MWCLKFFRLSVCILTLVINNYAAPKIRLNKTTDLWPLLEKHEIFQPTALVSDREGNFYIFDESKKAIYKFNSSFELVKSFGHKGQGPGEFLKRVNKLLLSPDGKLVLLENWSKKVHYFDIEGNFSCSFILKEIGIPHDLAIDRSGNHYFTDRGFYLHQEHVLIYDRNGKLMEMKLPDAHFITWADVTKKGTPHEQTERIAHLQAQHYRRITINRDSEIFIGRFDQYILEKYSANFKLIWHKEMNFERKVLPYASYNRRGTMPNVLGSVAGDGAIADLKIDDKNNIWTSIGIEESENEPVDDHLRHWIDVFDTHGNHITRLLENELPHNQRGYTLDIYKARLMVLADDRLLVYNILYD